jgi:hypothetical protein
MHRKAYFRRLAVWMAVLAVVLEAVFIWGRWMLGNWPPAPFMVVMLIVLPVSFAWFVTQLLAESNRHSN